MRKKIPTREKIVAAATILFWRNGYNAVSTGLICKRAGVSKSSLYHAFPSKSALLNACIENVWQKIWKEIQEIYVTPMSSREHLEQHLRWFADSQQRIKAEFGMILGTFDMALGVAIPEEAAAQMAANQKVHATLLSRTIASVAGLHPGSERARWVYDITSDLITGATIKARSRNDITPLLSLKDTVFKFIEIAIA